MIETLKDHFFITPKEDFQECSIKCPFLELIVYFLRVVIFGDPLTNFMPLVSFDTC